MPSKDKLLLVISGPTAIGKSSLSYEVQRQLGCAIVSADSRQVYREMCIGTAKPSKAEIETYRIGTVDYISVLEDYNAGIFALDAKKIIGKDHETHGYSMICGGTGLYIKALSEGLDVFPEVDPKIREELNDAFQERGIEYLQSELKRHDPAYAGSVDMNNPHRLIRALAVHKSSGQTYSSFLGKRSGDTEYNCQFIILDMSKDDLNRRIDMRVESMIEKGLVEEVKSLYALKDCKALNTVAYSELFLYFDGQYSLDEAVERIKIHTRQYAKRQRTWMKKYMPGSRFHPDDRDKIHRFIREKMRL